MYKLFLTVRYLLKPLSLVTIVALALSVVIFTAAPSVMNGFQEDFHERVRGTMSDMAMRSDRPLDVPLSAHLQAALQGVAGVTAVAPFIEHPALDRHFNRVDYCMIRGVDPRQEEKVGEFRSFILSDRDWFKEKMDYDVAKGDERSAIDEAANRLTPSPVQAMKELAAAQRALDDAKAEAKPAAEVKLREEDLTRKADEVKKADQHIDSVYQQLEDGIEDPMEPGKKLPAILAGVFFLRVYDLDVGSVVKLTTAAGEGSEVQQDRKFVVAGAFRAGSHDVDRRTVYMSLKTAQQFIGTSKISGYSIKLVDYNEARTVRPACFKAVEALAQTEDLGMRYISVKTWEQQNENLLKAVGMERLLIKLITGMIVLAASASIFLVLVMSIQFKIRELGILRAVGASSWGVLLIFLGQGLLLSFIGLVLGSALGLLGAHYINEAANFIHALTGWHPFPPEVYYLERIPSKIYWSEILVNAAWTMFFGLSFAFFPALVAALRPPIRAIRHD